ncbi:MAG TPA: hypothetical protein PKD75_10605 [Tepidiformaceae bacterium]|nr:hypothetical protein [Tepidiformaceae bacterium]
MANPGPNAVRNVRGMKPLGPMADDVTPPLLPETIDQLAQHLTLNADGFSVVSLPAEEISGLLEPFNGRARGVLVAMLRGYSQRMAAATVGVTGDTVTDWGKRHPEFAQALRKAADWGFSRTFERELHQRALAGPEDRGSMRALELVAKSRAPEYREKQQIAMEVTHRAEIALGNMVQGWSDDGPADSDRTE